MKFSRTLFVFGGGQSVCSSLLLLFFFFVCLFVCFCLMGVAHFSLFLGGRERERGEREREKEERERERGERERERESESWPKVHNLWVCLLCS